MAALQDFSDIAGLLQIEYDNDIMARNVDICKMSQSADYLYNFYSNFNPFVANYLDTLDKKEKELQDIIDDKCLNYTQKPVAKPKLTFENRKSLLRAATTNKILTELENEVARLEKENQELKEMLELI